MRTRISFKTAVECLSADVINFQSHGSSASKGESLKDTALTLEAVSADVVIVCHSSSGVAHRLAHAGWMNLSVLNVDDDTHQHPTQALPDMMTPRRHYAPSLDENEATTPSSGLSDAHVVVVGDVLHSRMVRSNVGFLTFLGARITLVTPPTFLPIGAETWSCATSYNFNEALAIHSDTVMMLYVWHEHMSNTGGGFFPLPGAYHAEYDLTPVCFTTLSPNAVAMHPDPMNRGLKICAEATDSNQSVTVE